MKHIVKNESPDDFERWKAQRNENWSPTYSTLRRPEKQSLHQALLVEQGWVCCYCGRRIGARDSHIEHFRPQDSHDSLALSYENLHASCLRETEPGLSLHCGHFKSDSFDETRHISPLDTGCEARFTYSLRGLIEPTEAIDTSASYMIELLRLDIAFLRNRREAALQAVFDSVFLESMTQEELRHLRASYAAPKEDGRKADFGHVLVRYAEQLLDDNRAKTA